MVFKSVVYAYPGQGSNKGSKFSSSLCSFEDNNCWQTRVDICFKKKKKRIRYDKTVRLILRQTISFCDTFNKKKSGKIISFFSSAYINMTKVGKKLVTWGNFSYFPRTKEKFLSYRTIYIANKISHGRFDIHAKVPFDFWVRLVRIDW